MKVETIPLVIAEGGPPNRRECARYAKRFGGDLAAELYDDDGIVRTRARAWLLGVRDRGEE